MFGEKQEGNLLFIKNDFENNLLVTTRSTKEVLSTGCHCTFISSFNDMFGDIIYA